MYLRLSLLLIVLSLFSTLRTEAQIGKSSKHPATSQNIDLSKLPRTIYSGEQGAFHVQGIAVDLERGCIYYSFTTSLVKTDLQGNLIGSVVGMTGHLGCLSLNPADGRVYGSIEYKNDEIGKGILHTLDAGSDTTDLPSGFYIAIFDGKRIDRPDMNAEKDHIMTTVYLKEVVEDYYGRTVNQGLEREHRFACSGIDGVAFGPAFGAPRDSKPYLHVAYGVYGDTTRTDNDYQVILAYDVADWGKYEQVLSQTSLHKSGPAKPLHKYFVRTGNTSYGIQNLAYDPASGNWLAAVYRGKKRAFPNYSLFMIDGTKAARTQSLQGFDTPTEGEVLSLATGGLYDKASGVRGWHFKWGTTGLCPIGGGYFYISQDGNTPDRKQHNSTVRLYRWTGETPDPFQLVE